MNFLIFGSSNFIFLSASLYKTNNLNILSGFGLIINLTYSSIYDLLKFLTILKEHYIIMDIYKKEYYEY